MAKKTNKGVVGTSFYETTILSSIQELTDILGSPQYNNRNSDNVDKVMVEWVCETEDGDVFTIYDWKEYKVSKDSDIIRFHIGGHSKEITENALKEITRSSKGIGI